MAKGSKPRLGQRLVAEFAELRDTLRARKPVEQRFTMRTIELDLQPKHYAAEEIRAIRNALGVSQAVFAKLMAVSVDTVAAWEQGTRTPSPIARRLVEVLQTNREQVIRTLEQASTP